MGLIGRPTLYPLHNLSPINPVKNSPITVKQSGSGTTGMCAGTCAVWQLSPILDEFRSIGELVELCRIEFQKL